MNYTIEELIEELQKLQKNAGGWNMPVEVNQDKDFTVCISDGALCIDNAPAKPEKLEAIEDLCRDIEYKADEIRDLCKELEENS